MFENVKAGWKLGGETRKLIMKDKQLFVYPVIMAFIGILLFILLLASFLLLKTNTILDIVLLFVYYVCVYFASTYTIIAMLFAFRSYTKGKKISIGEAFSQANQYLTLILEWAVFDAIITMIIRLIESRFRAGSGYILRLIIGTVVAFAFSVATFFVIPVIMDEKVGPIDAIKKSSEFIIANFGKTFGGIAYADLYPLIFVIGGIVAIIAGALIAGVVLIVGLIVAALGFALLVFGLLLSYVISSTVKLIIYDYMTHRANLPTGWDKSLIDNSLKKRNAAKTNENPNNAL